MKPVPPRIAVLFLLSGFGVLLMFGVVIAVLAGPLAVFAYLGLIVAPLVASTVRARQRRNRLATGRTCSCCTGSVHDPVQVV